VKCKSNNPTHALIQHCLFVCGVDEEQHECDIRKAEVLGLPLPQEDKPTVRNYEAAARYVSLQLGVSNEVESGEQRSDAYNIVMDVLGALTQEDA
jgi:hypothetical protein